MATKFTILIVVCSAGFAQKKCTLNISHHIPPIFRNYTQPTKTNIERQKQFIIIHYISIVFLLGCKANPLMRQGEFKHSWGTAEKLYKSEAIGFCWLEL